VGALGVGHAQITPTGDSYINTAASTTNYGAAGTLNVNGAAQTSFLQFDLSSVPAGASVSELDSVSCTSAARCVAVGASGSASSSSTLAERGP